MNPLPVAIGLTLCEKAMVEHGSKNISLISTFSTMVVREGFPCRPRNLDIHALFTDG